MKHPGESGLALYAGGDLPALPRWRISRHLRRCGACREEVAAFRKAREMLRADAARLPEGLDWTRLAGEMKANIHVGLAAGRCVAPAEPERRAPLGRVAALLAPVLLLLLVGFWLQRPGHKPPSPQWEEGTVIEASGGGIELRQGGRMLSLRHPEAANVTYTGSAQGSMRARYVDSETGQVTIQNVYAP